MHPEASGIVSAPAHGLDLTPWKDRNVMSQLNYVFVTLEVAAPDDATERLELGPVPAPASGEPRRRSWPRDRDAAPPSLSAESIEQPPRPGPHAFRLDLIEGYAPHGPNHTCLAVRDGDKISETVVDASFDMVEWEIKRSIEEWPS